ncbi:MAG: phosphoenolpyruvate synthase [Clostridiales bacterium]|nr:phosphoenolpyruvate synthase [Clostridiales bacterium]
MSMNNYKYIYPLKSVPKDKYDVVGGKGASLAHMISDLSLPVPSGYVLISDAVVNGEVREEALAELADLTTRLSPGNTYAVRSSALSEDGSEASFAGQYETLTDVRVENICSAVMDVADSASSARVTEYTDHFEASDAGKIAIVIQKFVKPEFAGVLFTSDIINGKNDHFVGNYVHGEGEKLVSGAENAKEFRIGTIHYSYEGPDEFRSYAKSLAKYCKQIRKYYGVPMDIEWAVSKKKVYILQARPITTLKRLDMETYEVNGTKSGYKMLTRTNVGEIFQKPVTPMTFSALEKINALLGVPDWLDNVDGQPYMNISVLCSLLVSFGKSEEAAFDAIKDLVGTIPPGVTVPIFPFSKMDFLKTIKKIIFPKNKSKLSKKEKKEMVEKLPEICRDLMADIRKLDSNPALKSYWDSILLPKLNDGLSAVMGASGSSMVPLFGTRKKIAKIAGEEMANRLCGGCVGTLDCMKPVLLLEDVLSGKLSKEEYIRICGHRSTDEMELASPRPYEDPSFLDERLEQHKKSGMDLHAMRKTQERAFEEALSEFKEKYPNKKKWIDKEIGKFAQANTFREDLRSKGVWIFSVFREYLLRIGQINGLGDDVFMLTIDEAFALTDDPSTPVREKIEKRKETYARYCTYPAFPMLIVGPFDPEKWMQDPQRRSDFFCEESASDTSVSSDVKGFPGAAGKVTGTVRVVTSIDKIDEIKEGDILVTVATNIGWTLVFPRVSAIVTDIGAPLSHAAIVAREFGIPAVVGCGNATTVLKSGDTVIVDGAAGTVTKLTSVRQEEV